MCKVRCWRWLLGNKMPISRWVLADAWVSADGNGADRLRGRVMDIKWVLANEWVFYDKNNLFTTGKIRSLMSGCWQTGMGQTVMANR